MVRNRTRLRAGVSALSVTLAAGLTVVLTSLAPQASAMSMNSQNASSPDWVKAYNSRLFYLVNRERTRHGLQPVKLVSCVDSWSKSWSRTMVEDDLFAHSNLGGLLDKCDAYYASENIAMIYDGARPIDLVRAWMDSPGHRANILSSKVRVTGVSIRWDSSQQAWVAVQNFARR